MGKLFKITLKPIVKDRDWEVRNIGANRKDKTCEICSKQLPPGHASTTFTKRTTAGMKTSYETHHTCNYHQKPECAAKMADKLNIDLMQSYVN